MIDVRDLGDQRAVGAIDRVGEVIEQTEGMTRRTKGVLADGETSSDVDEAGFGAAISNGDFRSITGSVFRCVQGLEPAIENFRYRTLCADGEVGYDCGCGGRNGRRRGEWTGFEVTGTRDLSGKRFVRKVETIEVAEKGLCDRQVGVVAFVGERCVDHGVALGRDRDRPGADGGPTSRCGLGNGAHGARR